MQGPGHVLRGAGPALTTILLGTAVLLTAPSAARAVAWLPDTSPYTRAWADPQEPRIGLTYAPDPDRLDGTLGAPIPIAAFRLGRGTCTAVLEGHANFRLGRDRSFFPLQTFDGFLAAGLEVPLRFGALRLRAVHWSAHRADGDTTIAYRGMTFSREYWTVDVEARRGGALAYVGGGSSWHAVPRDRGVAVRMGVQATWTKWDWRPFGALHIAADSRRKMRVAKTGLLGLETGRERPLRIALRAFSGPRPQGQYWLDIERYVGLDLSFTP